MSKKENISDFIIIPSTEKFSVVNIKDIKKPEKNLVLLFGRIIRYDSIKFSRLKDLFNIFLYKLLLKRIHKFNMNDNIHYSYIDVISNKKLIIKYRYKAIINPSIHLKKIKRALGIKQELTVKASIKLVIMNLYKDTIEYS